MTESANNTTFIKQTDPAIVDQYNTSWIISPGGQVVANNVTDWGTSNAVKLLYQAKLLYHINKIPNAYYKAKVTDTWHSSPSVPIIPTTPPIVTPPVPPVPPGANNFNTLTITIAGTSTMGVNPKFIVSLGANGELFIPPTSVLTQYDNVHWQTFTFKGIWPSPQTGYLTIVNAANGRSLVVKSISFDANTYTAGNNVVLSSQGQSASFVH